MHDFLKLSPIRFMDMYLVLLFLASVVRRIDLYRSVVGLVVKVPGRWPRLFQLVHQHKTALVTWPLLLPAVLALTLAVTHMAASRLVWPEATQPPHGLTVGDLVAHWWSLLYVVPLGLAMFAVDLYGIVRVAHVDQKLLEGYFDQAEYWLKSRTAHVVRIFTFGFVNPRRMVAAEVRKALEEATKLLGSTFRWISLQMGLRVAFGLSLWLTWVLTAF